MSLRRDGHSGHAAFELIRYDELCLMRILQFALDPEIFALVPPHQAHRQEGRNRHLRPWEAWGVLALKSVCCAGMQALFPAAPGCIFRKKVSLDTRTLQKMIDQVMVRACHVTRPMRQLTAAIGSHMYIFDIRMDPHGHTCVEHVVSAAPETPRIGSFGRPLPVGLCRSD